MDCSPPGSSAYEFSRQEYWSGLPFPSLGDLPDLGIKNLGLLHCRQILYCLSHLGSPIYYLCLYIYIYVGSPYIYGREREKDFYKLQVTENQLKLIVKEGLNNVTTNTI